MHVLSLRPNKKRSLLRRTWLTFLRAGGRFFFFLLKIFYTQIWYANLNFSRAGNSNSGTGSLAARRTSLPESPRRRMCWTVGHVRVHVTSSSPLSRASLAWAPLDRFRWWCEKRHGGGLLLLRQVSGVKCEVCNHGKDSLSPSATRNTESNVASSSTCRRRPLQKGSLSAWKLTNTATGISVDEKQLISWARTNRPKIEEARHVSFEVEAASRKKRKWCTICCRRQKSRCVDQVASHISTCAWVAAQKPGSTVKIFFPLLDFYSSTSLSRLRSMTQLATHGAAPKSIGREVEKKCPVGASKHGRSG